MVLAAFMVPWGIRNHKLSTRLFRLFWIGKPNCWGHIRVGYPDDNLDYETYVYEPMEGIYSEI
jgi:hypothetical protein